MPRRIVVLGAAGQQFVHTLESMYSTKKSSVFFVDTKNLIKNHENITTMD